jgi:glycine cleavage system aminomethyltransferase T
VPPELSTEGQHVEVEMRGKAVDAQIVKLPLVPHHSRPRATM